MGTLLFCVLLTLPLCWVVESSTGVKSNNVTILSQTNTRRLFARQKISSLPLNSSPFKSHVTTPARRCSSLMESCSSFVPCCHPCASCRCRLFKSICHCWMMNAKCLKKA
ncbi:agouti-signaling protein-like [Gouania willdenowi]|uniref:Agouti-signaling protein-like n=1 Tax=Gouania willdenowi TaxID=441366 RepID=A0A8C5DD32_GOUWI|nr:agouti-signaling protein-like [Gouania willdenowi]XP_028329294.1 agouti-signaling protein-like [Gouania willdenowi]XP_028329295.1 agouti-signaling protein-like [Gouania willdenowi]XP_028329296.1 agouti-signaling protein-like [Gouania willdenowi]